MINLKRKKYIVDKNQLRFCLKVIVINMLPLLVLSLTAMVVCFRLQKAQQLSFIWANPAEFLKSVQQFAPHFILAFFLANVAITWMTLLVYTNRVFGPIYGLEKRVKQVLSGEVKQLPRFRFRQGDEFVNLVKFLNQMNHAKVSEVLS